MKNLDFFVHKNKKHLDFLLLQGLASGKLIAGCTTCDSFARMHSGTCLAGRGAIEATEQWWDEKRATLIAKIQQSK